MNFGFCRTYHLHSVLNVTHNIYCAQSKCEKRSIILAHAHSCLSRSRFVRISAENRRLFLSHNIFDVLFVCFISKLMAWCRLSDRENGFFLFLIHIHALYLHHYWYYCSTIGFSCTPPPPNSYQFNCCHSVASYKCLPIPLLVLQTRIRKFHALFTGVPCFFPVRYVCTMCIGYT